MEKFWESNLATTRGREQVIILKKWLGFFDDELTPCLQESQVWFQARSRAADGSEVISNRYHPEQFREVPQVREILPIQQARLLFRFRQNDLSKTRVGLETSSLAGIMPSIRILVSVKCSSYGPIAC